MARSHREMTHILGLKDYPYTQGNTGWFVDSALESIKRRFSNLSQSPTPVNFRLVSDTPSAKIAKEVGAMANGDYLGFSAEWWTYATENLHTFLTKMRDGHAYSIHAVKEGNLTHLIYVNRGEPHYDLLTGRDVSQPAKVYAFTARTEKEAEALSKELFSAARSFNPRKSISEFINNPKHQINIPLSAALKKNNQKAGNCTIANSNVSWHFQLASNYMKQNPGTTLAVAYKKTEEQYRQMRLKDRKNAFQYLLKDSSNYLSERNYLFNYFQVLDKFSTRDYLNPGQNILQTLTDNFDRKTLAELMNPLLSDNFSTTVDEYIEDRMKSLESSGITYGKDLPEILRNNLYIARNKLLILHLQKFSESAQKKLIENDMSLLKGAKPELQKEYLNKDFEKYCLYASPKVLESYPSFDQQKMKDYLIFNNQVKSEHKTSGDLMLARGSAKKQANINNHFNALCSYLFMNDTENVKKTLEELCKICGERRFNAFGDKYSSDTESSKWLIEKLQSKEPQIVELRAKLGINAQDVEATVKGIIAEENNAPQHTADFKKRFQAQNGSDIEANPENALDATIKNNSPIFN